MSKGFATFTALASMLTFGAVWVATEPGGDSIAAVVDAATYYPGCDAVRAAGAAPLHRDEPGYRSEIDGDGDGIACEPYAGQGSGGGGGFGSGRRRHR